MLPQFKGIESIPKIVRWYLKKDRKLNYQLWNDREITESLIKWTINIYRDYNLDQIRELLNFLFHHLTYVLLPQLEQNQIHSISDITKQKSLYSLYNQYTYHYGQLQTSKLIYELIFRITFEPYGEPEEVLGLFEFTDYYSILGVSPTAQSDDIKRAYRVKAKIEHPDVGGNEESFKC